MRQCHVDVECLVCRQPVKLKFPKSANCTHCGATYTSDANAKVTTDKKNNLVVIQQTLVTGRGEDGNPIAVEQAIQWRL